jgi:membrane protease YdiL (CAAX protease family)
MSEIDPQDARPPESPSAPEPTPQPEVASHVPPPIPARRLPDDVYTPWGWSQLVLFLIVAFGSLILLTNIMALATVHLFGVKLADIKSFITTSATFLSLRTGLWYVFLVGYLYATICLGRRWPFWRTVGWRDVHKRGLPRPAGYALLALGGMVLAVVIQLASLAFPTKAQLPIEVLFHNRVGILWLMGVGILVAPAVEETIFRGYLYPVLARSVGVEGGILLTGLLFGLMHAPQLWGGWGQIGLLVLVGIVLTYARAKTGSVVASWLLHLGYNTFLFAGFFISTGGLRHLPPVS